MTFLAFSKILPKTIGQNVDPMKPTKPRTIFRNDPSALKKNRFFRPNLHLQLLLKVLEARRAGLSGAAVVVGVKDGVEVIVSRSLVSKLVDFTYFTGHKNNLLV